MRTGPCVFDPGASPAAPQPHAYSTIPQPLQLLPPLPWVQYGSKAKPLLGSCLISKQVWLKLWGKGKCGDSLFNRLTSSTKAIHWFFFFFFFFLFTLSDVLLKFCLLTVKIHERFQTPIIWFQWLWSWHETPNLACKQVANSTFGFFVVVVFSQDGGLLINNPTALAIHECQCLWPDTPLECVVSLGTGRFESTGKSNAAYTSLKTKLTNVISSATDTEGKDAPRNDGDLMWSPVFHSFDSR